MGQFGLKNLLATKIVPLLYIGVKERVMSGFGIFQEMNVCPRYYKLQLNSFDSANAKHKTVRLLIVNQQNSFSIVFKGKNKESGLSVKGINSCLR